MGAKSWEACLAGYWVPIPTRKAATVPEGKTKAEVEVTRTARTNPEEGAGKPTRNQARDAAAENPDVAETAKESIPPWQLRLPFFKPHPMLKSITTVHLYLESAFRNEDFHHTVEHRFFEHEVIKDFENEEHTSISAFAHVTGIYFKIVTQKWSSGEIFKTFEAVLNGNIPPFSKEEAARFESELRERK